MRKAAVLGLAIAAAGCGSPAKLTESQEYYVGRGVAANAVLQTQGFVQHEELESYVNLVGQTIALESERPETYQGYHFGVLKSDLVNAFCAPGGFVFVTTGALRKMENEDELAGVLAHEIAHVNLRHPEEFANRETQKSGVMDILAKGGHLAEVGGGVASTVFGALGKPREAEAVAKVSENLAKVVKAFGGVLDSYLQEIMVNGYGRDSELAADALAVDLLTRPGVRYDPSALKAFVSRLPPAKRGAWSTHPDLEGRGENIDRKIKERGVRSSVDPARSARFKAMTAFLGQ